MRSFATREACLKYFEEQFPTLPPFMIEMCLDFDLQNPNIDPEQLRNSITPEARELAEQFEAEERQYTQDQILEQGIIFDDPADVPQEPLAPGVIPGEALDSDDEDSDLEYPKSMQYHPRDKNLLGSNTSSSEEETNSDSDSSTTKLYNDTLYLSSSDDEQECATQNDQPSTTD